MEHLYNTLGILGRKVFPKTCNYSSLTSGGHDRVVESPLYLLILYAVLFCDVSQSKLSACSFLVYWAM